MKGRLLVLQHVPMEGPERIADLAAARGLDVDVCEVFGPRGVPTSFEGTVALVVMGGSMGVGDIGDPRYPYLAKELALLEKALEARHPILGVCLGSQLLARAAGAEVYPATRTLSDGRTERLREVGWGTVRWNADPDKEPILRGIGATTTVLHWHGDTFDLPPGAVHLASSERCRNQAFRLGPRAFGLQFHVEVRLETVPRWVDEDAAFVELANGPGGGRRILDDTPRLGPQARDEGDRLISNIFDCMLG
jgi:GMP synthase-like glutamine amidotransferase